MNAPSREALMLERLPIGPWGHSRVTWRTAHLLHVSPDTFWACFVAAAPLSSDVTDTVAFPPLVLSQRHVSRRGIFGDRHVTTVEERERPATRDPAMVLMVPQTREALVEMLI
ncbi:hypothetical protein GJ744_008592 [Endocarpon pusillum]|uniref:Uncharacterized protein n=1 Tax=Endocarpon pusillum TaxID=364733 RepID=A0A8H7AH19_9EURO|nr:hypothetical protein GJ744_008592 [Endocarpon pusillum]